MKLDNADFWDDDAGEVQQKSVDLFEKITKQEVELGRNNSDLLALLPTIDDKEKRRILTRDVRSRPIKSSKI